MKKSHKITLAALGILTGVGIYNFSAPVKTMAQNSVAESLGGVEIEYHNVEVNGTTVQKPFVLGIFELPPVPDPIENAATLGGVDSNQNMVRDDVERHILLDTEYFTSPKLKAFGLQKARVYQYINTIDEHKDIDMKNMLDHIGIVVQMKLSKEFSNQEYLDNKTQYKSIFINLKGVYKELEHLSFNTKERKLQYARLNGSVGGVANGISNPGRFAYRYADFDLEALERGEYKWLPEKYGDRIIANYEATAGGPSLLIYKGRYIDNEENDERITEWFYGFKSRKETLEVAKIHNKICSSHTLQELRDMNYIQGWDRYWEYKLNTTRPEDLL